jgi:hypothetical protein
MAKVLVRMMSTAASENRILEKGFGYWLPRTPEVESWLVPNEFGEVAAILDPTMPKHRIKQVQSPPDPEAFKTETDFDSEDE